MNILLLNQFFYPDVASTAQHAADLARELARQGHQVTVLAGRRAYDDPRVSLPAGQWWEGIRIRRVWHTGFGKRARWRRGRCSNHLAGMGVSNQRNNRTAVGVGHREVRTHL